MEREYVHRRAEVLIPRAKVLKLVLELDGLGDSYTIWATKG
jgi:hypothetical protein